MIAVDLLSSSGRVPRSLRGKRINISSAMNTGINSHSPHLFLTTFVRITHLLKRGGRKTGAFVIIDDLQSIFRAKIQRRFEEKSEVCIICRTRQSRSSLEK